jgi:hypothetical protein
MGDLTTKPIIWVLSYQAIAQGIIPTALIGGIAKLSENTASSDASQSHTSTAKKTPSIIAYFIIDSVTTID